jgi:hypothetical protein
MFSNIITYQFTKQEGKAALVTTWNPTGSLDVETSPHLVYNRLIDGSKVASTDGYISMTRDFTD